ncbi:DUF5723 family protein [Algoriphagus terrigena]|uniref:DUF5723 family protein n=1 Tax=Algoriphagus terrigena TaxID=344884 RepID=UPI00047D2155|nr:DUF5723 family protein [Algoriphagus terrigena]
MKKLAALLVLTAVALPTMSQNFVGAQIDSRVGVQSLTLNPALGTLSRANLDINLIGGSAFAGSDYLSINLSDLDDVLEGLSFDDDVVTNPQPDNNFFGNVDILGPSVLMRLNARSMVSLTTRARGFFNLNNIDGDFYELVANSETGMVDFTAEMEDLSGIAHVWGEIGLGYSRVLVERANHSFSGGANLKLLLGAGGVFGNTPQLSADYNSSSNLLSTLGTLDYGYSLGFDSDDVNFSEVQPGFAVDLGFIYELKGNTEGYDYKLRAGVSVLDIGSVQYHDGYRVNYDMSATISGDEFVEKDFQEVLEDNYTGTERPFEGTLGLPTSLQIFLDYGIGHRFYVSAQAGIALSKDGEIPVSRVINTATITPRMEMRWLSVYSPISYRQYDSTASWGLGVRIGPVLIGSGSILTNAISKKSRTADVYAAIKLPIYGKDKFD